MSDLSGRKLLTPYLFTRMEGSLRRRYGVSAYSLEDAVSLSANGYPVDPHDPAISVRENIVLHEFENGTSARRWGRCSSGASGIPRVISVTGLDRVVVTTGSHSVRSAERSE